MYQGYQQTICRRGHYQEVDALETPGACEVCQEPVRYYCAVDTTNGVEPEIPDSFPAPFKQVNIEDTWHTDRHGNKFATSIPIVVPEGDRWINIDGEVPSESNSP